jgi:endoglucanase
MRSRVIAVVVVVLASTGAVVTRASGGKVTPPATCVTPPHTVTSVVRVDQVGYPSRSEKVAEIMTAASSGTVWRVVKLVSGGRCAVVDSGRTTADLGSWSSHYPFVWAADFSSVTSAGRYRVEIGGNVSPWFSIGPAASVYAAALHNALTFYENERDGPDFIASALRTAAAHLNDEHAAVYATPPFNSNDQVIGSLHALGSTIDASGGWWDAGDYLKFVETHSYTVALLLQGVESFPASMRRFRSEALFGVHWLEKMWNESSKTLIYQVGLGSVNGNLVGDHDIWRLPQADDHYGGRIANDRYIRHRPVFRAGPPGSPISPNLAGRLTADFALCYRVFRSASCLRDAETIYSLAGTHWHGRLVTTAPWDFYPESSWQDDMMLGATELALAERAAGNAPAASTYLRDAGHWAHSWITGPQAASDTLNLYDVSGLGDYELAGALRLFGSDATRVGVTGAQLKGNMQAQLERAIGIGAKDPFRFGFAWDQWDTTTHGAGMSIEANEYDALVGRPVYGWLAQRWLDDIFGSNSWGTSLIVGDGSVFPDCMQHQVANLVGSLNGSKPVLAGATVEGPNSFAASGLVAGMRNCSATEPGGEPFSHFDGHKAVYRDNMQAYSNVEPAIDLTAPTPLAFSWQIATGGGATSPASLPPA